MSASASFQIISLFLTSALSVLYFSFTLLSLPTHNRIQRPPSLQQDFRRGRCIPGRLPPFSTAAYRELNTRRIRTRWPPGLPGALGRWCRDEEMAALLVRRSPSFLLTFHIAFACSQLTTTVHSLPRSLDSSTALSSLHMRSSTLGSTVSKRDEASNMPSSDAGSDDGEVRRSSLQQRRGFSDFLAMV